MSKISAFLFDMDGTLIDTECYYRRCWPAALKEFGYTMTDEQALLMRSLGRPYAPKLLQEWFGDALDYWQVRDRRKAIMEEMIAREGIRVKPGAVELLTCLNERGIARAVVTATDAERAERYLKQVGLEPYFDAVIGATSVERGKPAPDIYEYACGRLGRAPEECVAVEDSPNGVRSAYGAGMRVIMVPDQTEPDEELNGILWKCVPSLDRIRECL